MKLTLLILVCLISLISPALALESLLISPDKGEQSLSNRLEIYRDTTQKLGIDDVIRQDFETVQSDTPNMGFSQDAYWIRFQVQNQTDQEIERLLELAHPNIDQVWFYREQPGHQFSETKTGRQVAFAQRDLAHRNYVFPLKIPA